MTKSIVSNLVWTINCNPVDYVIWRVHKEKWVQFLIIALCNKENNWYLSVMFYFPILRHLSIATKDPSGLLSVHFTFFLRCIKKSTSSSGNLIRESSHDFVGTVNYRRWLGSSSSPVPSVPHSTDDNFITFAIEEKPQKSLGPRATLTTNYDHWCIVEKYKVI